MNIAVNLRTFVQGNIGGLEAYVRHLIARMAARGHRMALFVSPGQVQNVREFAPDSQLISAGKSNANWKLRTLLSSGSCDILFCPLLTLEPLSSPIPSAVMIPDLQHEFFPEFFTPEALAWRRCSYRPSALQADVVFTLSDHARGTIEEKLGVDPSKIIVTHLDAGDDFHRSSTPDAVAAFDALKLPERYIYFPANFWPHKNHSNLLEALRLLTSRHPNLHLVLTGAPDTGQKRVQSEASRLKLAARVCFLGYQPRPVVAEIYRHSCALAFPSRFEGFGIPIVEAFRSGTPVLASNTTSCPEVAGDAGLLVDPDDPGQIAEGLHRLLTEPGLRSELIAKGLHRAARFSWDVAADQTLAEFDRLVSSGRRCSRVSVRDFPRVSIVTPSFNMARFLDETIQSVLAQDYPHIEYVVMDGGSRDGTLDILRKYEHRLRYVSAPDGGQPDAINRGFELTTGSIFAFLNADDTYLPGAVSTAVGHLLDNPGVGVIYGEAYHVEEDGRVISRYPTREFDYAALNGECYICQPASFMRRETFDRAGRMHPDLQYAPDYDLWIRIGKLFPMLKVDEYLATSRMHRENKTLGKRRQVYQEIIQITRNRFGYVPFNWIYGYSCFLMDGKDQFFERGTRSLSKFALSLALGSYYNRKHLLRYGAEIASTLGLTGEFTGRWDDGWISERYLSYYKLNRTCRTLRINGKHLGLRGRKLHLEVNMNDSVVARHDVNHPGSFSIEAVCPPELRGTTVELGIVAGPTWRPILRGDCRRLSCLIQSVDFEEVEETRCGSLS